MIKVELNIEMPISCSECRMNGKSSCWNGGYCILCEINGELHETSVWNDKRPWFCPLEKSNE